MAGAVPNRDLKLPPANAEHLGELIDEVILVTRCQGIGPGGPVIVESAGHREVVELAVGLRACCPFEKLDRFTAF